MRHIAVLPPPSSLSSNRIASSHNSVHSIFGLLKIIWIAAILAIAIGTLDAQPSPSRMFSPPSTQPTSDVSSLASPTDFSIILLPDAQNETQYYPQVLASQTAWVAKNQAALNIQVFLGLGDLVNDGASDVQDGNADAAIRTLDNAGIPYFLAIGNHDYDGALPRNATGFNRWFGPARYANYSYYKGNYPTGSNENSYGVLTINGTQYLFLVLEFVPRDAALQWAASILDANQEDRKSTRLNSSH